MVQQASIQLQEARVCLDRLVGLISPELALSRNNELNRTWAKLATAKGGHC